MSAMSNLDLMVREGDTTVEDFIGRGYGVRDAEAMAEVVARTAPVEAMLGPSKLSEDISEERTLEVLRDFGLIDSEGYYTIYETKR